MVTFSILPDDPWSYYAYEWIDAMHFNDYSIKETGLAKICGQTSQMTSGGRIKADGFHFYDLMIDIKEICKTLNVPDNYIDLMGSMVMIYQQIISSIVIQISLVTVKN